ncbi:putative methyltransferase-domain-containing protein [Hypomontagnella monticulosa]|nr:putative methyltransferase-domain-containing protein [Hypomontagnella monticulosa]
MMADREIDPQLLLLRRQYLQLFEPDFLAWPPAKFLNNADVQTWLYKHLFDPNGNPRLPPEKYQLEVLKHLIAKVKNTNMVPDENEVSNDLVARFTYLMSKGVPSEFLAMREEAYVTFTCMSEDATSIRESGYASDPTITLLERRHLVTGSRVTGFRTWEAALHLGSYFLTYPGSRHIRGKNVLELGAGTGLLTILSAKHIHANHVTSTDGEKGVIETLCENLSLNGLNDPRKVGTGTLAWGQGLKGTWIEDDCEAHPYDLVVGADITYEKTAILALVSTLQSLFDMRPQLIVIISGVVRNAETFQIFRDECVRNGFTVEDIKFQPKPIRQQSGLFYAAAVPIKILSITYP